MIRSVRERLTFANVTSVLALFVALGGSAAAVVQNNSVDSQAIINGEVSTNDLAPGSVKAKKLGFEAVTSAAIDQGAVTASDLHAGSVKAGKLAFGAVTSAALFDGGVTASDLHEDAVTTSTIKNGEVRAFDLGPLTVVHASGPLRIRDDGIAIAYCPPDQDAISGGGLALNDNTFDTSLLGSFPVNLFGVRASNGETPKGWAAYGWNGGETGLDGTMEAWVVCLA